MHGRDTSCGDGPRCSVRSGSLVRPSAETLNGAVAPRMLLGGFVVLMVVAGIAMLRRAGAPIADPGVAMSGTALAYVGAGAGERRIGGPP